VLELVSDSRQGERDLAFGCAGLASIGALAVESGEVPADVVLPIARQAVADAEQLGFPGYKLAGTNAVLALLDGDPARAVSLARSAVSVTDHALSRADDLATLARALMPRVAGTRTRLEID
jgi:hypothetical protein